MSAFVEKVGLCGFFFVNVPHLFSPIFDFPLQPFSFFFCLWKPPRINGVDDRKFLDYQLLAIITARFYQQRGFLLSFRYHCNIGFFFYVSLHQRRHQSQSSFHSSFYWLFFFKRTARNGGTYVIYDDRMPEVDGGIGRFQIRVSFYNVSAL